MVAEIHGFVTERHLATTPIHRRKEDSKFWVPVPIQYPVADYRDVSLDVGACPTARLRIRRNQTRLTVRRSDVRMGVET
jgi:hypothetical protein